MSGLHSCRGNFCLWVRLSPLGSLEIGDTDDDSHLLDMLAWDQWDTGGGYKRHSPGLINKLDGTFSPAPRVEAIDSVPSHPLPLRATLAGRRTQAIAQWLRA